MTRRVCGQILTISAVSLTVAGADVANLSGTWHLNVERSSWGRKRKPQSVAVTVEHNEPALKYFGTVTDDIEGGGRPFKLEATVDGKEYPYREGKISIRRIDSHTTVSAYRSDDGTIVENARTTLSKDGRTLTRQIEAKGPDATMKWTEVYERR
jgi:hypothetical protein